MANMNIYDMTDTWSSGTTTYSAIKMNVTDNGSASDSKILQFQIGGSDKLVLTKDGYLGIGNSSPGYTLDVNGSIYSSGSLSTTYASTGSVSPFSTPTALRGLRLQNTDNTTNTAVGIDFVAGSSATSTSYIVGIREGSYLGALAFGTRKNVSGDYAEAVRIASSGNVGIGTSSPSSTLAVYGGNIQISTSGKGIIFPDGTSQTTAYVTKVTTLSSNSSVTFDVSISDIVSQTNTQSVGTLTVNSPTGTSFDGQKVIFRLKSTNSQTFSWNSVFRGSTDLPLPTASTGSSKTDYMTFLLNATDNKWDLIDKKFGY